MDCQFCGNEIENEVVITDKETLQEISICELCYCEDDEETASVNLQQLRDEEERKIDEIIDCQIDDLKLQRIGVEI